MRCRSAGPNREGALRGGGAARLQEDRRQQDLEADLGKEGQPNCQQQVLESTSSREDLLPRKRAESCGSKWTPRGRGLSLEVMAQIGSGWRSASSASSRSVKRFGSRSQMVYILPERLPALVRPAFDLLLRRIRSLKRCVEA